MKPWKKTPEFQLKKLKGRTLYIRQLELIRERRLCFFHFEKHLPNQTTFQKKHQSLLAKGDPNELILFVKDASIPLDWFESKTIHNLYDLFLKNRPDLTQNDFPSSFFTLYTEISALLEYQQARIVFLKVCCKMKGGNPNTWNNYKQLISSYAWMQDILFTKFKRLTALQHDKLQGVLEYFSKEELTAHLIGRTIALLSTNYIYFNFVNCFHHFYHQIFPQLASLFPKPIYDKYKYRLFVAWFKFWIHHQYPLLQGDTIHAPYSKLSAIPLQQIIQYVPRYMLGNMEKFTPSDSQLFVHLAKGHNLRRLPPFQLFPKKTSHYFQHLPCLDIPFQHKFICSFLYAIGFVDLRIIQTLARYVPIPSVYKGYYSYRPKYTSHEDSIPLLVQQLESRKAFFLKIKQWLEQDLLSASSNLVNRMASYDQHCRDEGIPFNLKQRTVASVERLVRQWEEERNNLYSNAFPVPETWEGANYRDDSFSYKEDTYKVVQLTTIKDLREEGETMHHCVGGYAYRCASGDVSIWSLRLLKNNGTHLSKVTIEVNSDGYIVQAKGPVNQQPTETYLEIIQMWARANDIEG